MDSIKSWASIVCVCSVIACLVDMITPNGKMDKAIRFVLGAFMLCAVFIPLVNTISGITAELNPISSSSVPNELNEQVAESFSEQSKLKIEALASTLLKENNIDYKKINVFMDINEDFSISIIKIIIEMDRGLMSQANTAKELIEKNLGIETEIEFS